ncbi:MAG TPA: hypothetical protein PKV74_08245 [Syntrophales bacterium]|nr:hypothetical protein [Syntrophales bacterium]
MDQLGETKQINAAIQETFARIEASLPEGGGITALFTHVLRELQEAFAIPFAWLSLIKRPETESWPAEIMKSPFLKDRLNQIDAAAFAELTGEGGTPVLANGDLKAYYRLLPPDNKYFIKSIAVAPLVLRGLAMGSLNFGDASPARYHAGLDSSQLARLAVAVANRLGDYLAPGPPEAVGPGSTAGE